MTQLESKVSSENVSEVGDVIPINNHSKPPVVHDEIEELSTTRKTCAQSENDNNKKTNLPSFDVSNDGDNGTNYGDDENVRDGKNTDDHDDNIIDDNIDDNGDDETIDVGRLVEEVYPVDTGWAWCIMVSNFMIHVLAVAGAKSFGVLFEDMQEKYDADAKELGIINGMALTLMFGLGIIANMLAERFSIRRVVLTGSVLISTGFITTAFVPSFGWLYLSYGLTVGVGLGLCFSPVMVLTGKHFKKYRSFALGCAMAGSGFGSFSIPNLLRFLLKKYGLQGSLIIFGAVLLNNAVAAFLLPSQSTVRYRTLSKNQNLLHGEAGGEEEGEGGIRNKKEAVTCSCNDRRQFVVNEKVDSADHMKSSHKETKIISRIKNCDQQSKHESNESKLTSLSTGDISFGLSLRGNEESKVGSSRPSNYNNNKLSNSTPLIYASSYEKEHLIQGNTLKNNENKLQNNSAACLFDSVKGKLIAVLQKSHSESLSAFLFSSNCELAPLAQKELDVCSSIGNKNKYGNINMEQSDKKSNVITFVGNSDKEIKTQAMENGTLQKPRPKRPPIFDWRLLKNLEFLLDLLCIYFGYACYINVLFMLPDYASDNGLSRDMAALTLSIVGILELIARMTFGSISDHMCCNRRIVWTLCMTFVGLVNILLPSINTMEGMMSFAAFFGYSCGAFTSLIPVLMAEINGPEKMSSSYGMATLVMMMGVMTGPPICGTIKDKTGQWDYAFVTIGVLCLVGVLFSTIHMCTQKFRKLH